jgi:YbbR domain-containing protein
VTRVLGFLVRNWPLKLSAVILATVLYAGLALSQNARVWPGRVPIQPLNQPSSAFILGTLPDVTNIQYFAPPAAADRLSSAAFTASIDLKDAKIDPASPFVTVRVDLMVNDGNIRIIDYSPRQVTVRLDPIISRTVPVRVVQGDVPEGLQVSPPQLSQTSVTATGPESVISQISTADARVRIQPSGIDVDQLVDLIAVDGRGEQLQPVELSPANVRVRIQVGAQITTKSVPISVVVTGTPADGFEIARVVVRPAVATVSGDAQLLAGLSSVPTREVNVEGATASMTTAVALDLAQGMSAVGADTVQVTFTLRAKGETRNFNAGVILLGAQPDRPYSLAVGSVVVTLGGGLQALAAVDATSLTASVDVAGLDAGSHDVTVRVATSPGTTVVSVSPPQVTVFVGPRATPPPTPEPTPLFVPTFSPIPSPAAGPGTSP